MILLPHGYRKDDGSFTVFSLGKVLTLSLGDCEFMFLALKQETPATGVKILVLVPSPDKLGMVASGVKPVPKR